MSIKIPKSPKDIDKEWLHEVLKLSGTGIGTIEVIEIDMLKEKTGFLSGALKAKVKIHDQEENLFIKTIIGQDDPFRSFYDTNNLDELEIRFYKVCIRKGLFQSYTAILVRKGNLPTINKMGVLCIELTYRLP